MLTDQLVIPICSARSEAPFLNSTCGLPASPWLTEISCQDIGVEALFGQKDNGDVKNILWVKEMEMKKLGDNRVSFSCSFHMDRAGGYDYIFRIFPKSELVPYRQSLRLVKWI